MKKQTAVEWYSDAVQQHILTFGSIQPKVLSRFKKQAKKMERDQIVDAVEWGNRKGYDEHTLTIIHDLDQEYYEQTYGGEKVFKS